MWWQENIRQRTPLLRGVLEKKVTLLQKLVWQLYAEWMHYTEIREMQFLDVKKEGKNCSWKAVIQERLPQTPLKLIYNHCNAEISYSTPSSIITKKIWCLSVRLLQNKLDYPY